MSRAAGAVCVAMILLVLALVGCGDDDDGSRAGGGDVESEATTTSTTVPAGPTAAELCAGAEAVTAGSTLAQPALVEVSGLAASRQNDGLVWAHNDSGGLPEVFALGEDGADAGRYPVEGAEAFDWEDMALGPGPDPGVDYLYLGDIGDNAAQRSGIVVYRVPEPEPGAAVATGGERLDLTYPDGARDAETLLSDPVTGDLYVVSKAWDGGSAGLYRIPVSAAPGQPLAMERVGDVAVPAGQLATGGDISADGALVAVRTYGQLLLWDRGPDQTVADALAASPCEAPVAVEAQGEAVALAPDGRGYVTIGEGAAPAVNWFRLP